MRCLSSFYRRTVSGQNDSQGLRYPCPTLSVNVMPPILFVMLLVSNASGGHDCSPLGPNCGRECGRQLAGRARNPRTEHAVAVSILGAAAVRACSVTQFLILSRALSCGTTFVGFLGFSTGQDGSSNDSAPFLGYVSETDSTRFGSRAEPTLSVGRAVQRP